MEWALNVSADEEVDDVLPVPVDDIGPWSEGTEHFAATPEETIDECLGINDWSGNFPNFNNKVDPEGIHDAWSQEGRAALEKDTALPLRPRWHQKVGVLRMMERLMDNLPCLLMDEVGVGKTMQIIGAITTYVLFHRFYEAHKKFPGEFGE